MPSYKKYSGSRYLKKEDLEDLPALLVTTSSVKEENVAPDGQPPQIKLVAHYRELERGLVLNMTNCEVYAAITGTDDFTKWAGVVVEIFVDPTVRFRGKIEGGLRLRKPSVKLEEPVEEPVGEPDEETVPF